MTKDSLALSVVIIAHNEQEHIAECIKSLDGLAVNHEILVVDDMSTDKTVAIATKHGAKVVKRALNEDFAGQRNWALSQTKGEWVFFIDADERCSMAGIEEVNHFILKPGNFTGAYFKRYDFFGGRLLRHGEIGHVKLVRLARRNFGQWKGRVDEIWEGHGVLICFKNPLTHYSHPTLTQFIANINQRSLLNANMLFESGVKVVWYDWGKPVAKFVINYIIRLGFLDGLPGFVFAVLMSFHSFLVRGKLYLLWQRKNTRRLSSAGRAVLS